jgi:transcriptional regulator with XRE-family HTH domain
MPEFKDMLKYYRLRENLSQSELAGKLGLSPSTVSMYEVGKREPDFETEEKIADFFNTDLNTLRGYDTEINPNYSYINDSDEKIMVSKYRLLNDEGKIKLIERADELRTLGYIKEDSQKMA